MGVIHHTSFFLVFYIQSKAKISCMITFKYLSNTSISLHRYCYHPDLGHHYLFTGLKQSFPKSPLCLYFLLLLSSSFRLQSQNKNLNITFDHLPLMIKTSVTSVCC
jgi:hypothetical protein